MPDFNYWLFAGSADGVGPGIACRFSSHSVAMKEARFAKGQYPSWSVFVEVLPAGEDHPDVKVGDDGIGFLPPGPGGLGGDRGVEKV
jgi:hypothetical protein